MMIHASGYAAHDPSERDPLLTLPLSNNGAYSAKENIDVVVNLRGPAVLCVNEQSPQILFVRIKRPNNPPSNKKLIYACLITQQLLFVLFSGLWIFQLSKSWNHSSSVNTTNTTTLC